MVNTLQILFMVWNAINDPLFGWLSDRKMPTSRQVAATPHCRSHALLQHYKIPFPCLRAICTCQPTADRLTEERKKKKQGKETK